MLRMRDPRLDKLADVLVNFSTSVRGGDLVTIVGEPECMEPVEALFEAVLRAGGHPSFHPRPERLHELMLRHASDDQLRHVCPFEEFRLARCDVLMVLRCPRNTRYLGRVDPARVAMAQAARRGLLTMSLRRKAAGETRYVLTEIPSQAAAQEADMSLTDYAEWVYRAGFLHLPDPLAAWRRLREQHERLLDRLQRCRELRITAPSEAGSADGRAHEGTDVTVDVSGRRWCDCSGQENFPDGEVYSGPRSVDGVVNFTFPAIHRGREVTGVRLEFRGGRVIAASATRNEAYLLKLLDQDAGARNAGEIAFGTNYALDDVSRNEFFNEKVGGTFHIAVGAGYPETGNTNESALHWDLVGDLRRGGAVYADGELIQQEGRFVFPGWPGN